TASITYCVVMCSVCWSLSFSLLSTSLSLCAFFFFFSDTATTEIYTLSLHDALPISGLRGADGAADARRSPRGDVRPPASGRAPLQHAAAHGPHRRLRHPGDRRSRRVVDDHRRRAHLHAEAAPRRALPRRQRDDVEGRQGELR